MEHVQQFKYDNATNINNNNGVDEYHETFKKAFEFNSLSFSK